MSFDVPKLVRSIECDHGHDEESRNGRDIKIDILGEYVRTPEVFRVISEKTGVPEGYRNPPEELMGHMGLGGKREGRPGWAARPLGPNWTRGKGAAPPLALSYSLSLSLFLLSYSQKEKGNPTSTWES